jgi:carboxyl-terminal processing protease
MQMNTSLRRWIVICVLTLIAPLNLHAEDQQLASVEQLKSEAFKALRGGHFDQTGDLLAKAASISKDPSITQMSDWIHQFQSQRAEYITERKKAYDKAVEDVKKLETANFDDAAMDRMRDAYLMAADKDATLKESWFSAMLAKTKQMAADYEAKQRWLKAQRAYSDLAAIETINAPWKDKFNSSTEHLRMLAMYTPDEYRKIVDDELKQRDAAEQLIMPTTQPTTRALPEENENFKIDWHDMLQGVRLDMLVNALDDARGNYWRDISYKTLITSGLKGLEAFVVTPGLDKAFPNLADPIKRDAFLDTIHQSMDTMTKSAPKDEAKAMRHIFDELMATNQTSLQLPEEVVVNEFAEATVSSLDPFSKIYWPYELDDFNKTTQGEFEGVGIQIRLDEDGNLKVVSPLEDSPAYKLGIAAGDIITRINGKNAKGINVNEAVKNITGPGGTSVILTIKHPDQTVKDYTIYRERIHVASVKGYRHLPGGKWDYFVDPDQKIGYVRLTNFSRSTNTELGEALSDMQANGAKAIVLDLRNNPGGLLTSAIEVCDRFLSEGVIVSTRGEREMPGQPPAEATASKDDVTLPLVVLVNQTSASASEIVSGALQDDKRALIVGERTFGKGSVQILFALAGHTAAVKLTTSHYYLPSGRCIHKEDNSTVWGVDPDLVVEMTVDQMRAAQEARTEMEVLREGDTAPVPVAAIPTTNPTTAPVVKKDLLSADPQLSASVLLLKLELAGAPLETAGS